ncbi:MAG: hypothetical protein HY508_02475 [Acidobacteria bacterium]|nr:hypothetical protein [Acidobacteriota bacterium]
MAKTDTIKTPIHCPRLNPIPAGCWARPCAANAFRRLLLLAALCILLSAIDQQPCARAQTDAPSATKGSELPPSRIDPKAQGLLNQAVRALGGDAFLNAKSIRTQGRIFTISEDTTSGVAPYESTVQYPGKRRFTYGKDKPVTLINDGERGWQLDRYGMVRQPPDQVRLWDLSSRYGYDSLLRTVIREKGLLIQYSGTEFAGPVSTQIISITDSARVQIRLNLDSKTSLPVRVSYRLFNQQTSEWEEYADVYADFKEFQGIKTPMQITRFLNGERSGENYRKNVEYNVEIPANYFTPGG